MKNDTLDNGTAFDPYGTVDYSGLPQGKDNLYYEIIHDTVVIFKDEYIRDADYSKDGGDLVFKSEQGTITVRGYFETDSPPTLIGSQLKLTPEMVQAFLNSSLQYAGSESLNDQSPIGHINEANGEAIITRTDGLRVEVEMGTPVYEGDLVETNSSGALNIVFSDESSFAVSGDSRLTIDEYVYDASTHEGKTDFSILKGLFVYTSGLIGLEDPDDVSIETPMGSIGIRGTVIAGDVNNHEITVVEGAIYLQGNHGMPVTLSHQFETAKFTNMGIQPLGELNAHEIMSKFSSMSDVAADLFSTIAEQIPDETHTPENNSQEEAPENAEEEKGVEIQDGETPTDKLMQGEGSGTENIQEINEAKELADQLNEELKNTDLEADEQEFHRIEVTEDDIPYIRLRAEDRNLDPQLVDIHTPKEFFASTTGTLWAYDFSDVFRDPEGRELTFAFTDDTKDRLQFLEDSGFISDFSLDQETGIAQIDTHLFLSNEEIQLKVFAVDSDGKSSEAFINKFTFYRSSELTSGSHSGGDSTALETYREGSHDMLNLDYTRLFLNDQNGTFKISGDNNEIHMGENGSGTIGRTVRLEVGAENNHVIGGTKADRVEVLDANNRIETLDGNDVVSLGTGIDETQLNIDMGKNEESYAEAFVEGKDLSGATLTSGDRIEIFGSGDLDLSQVPEIVKNIETIRFDSNKDQELHLSLENVFDMSDSQTLVIDTSGFGSSNADLNLTGGTWAGRDTDRDGHTDTETFGGETYEIWDGTGSSGENVTLLVDQTVEVNIL